MLNLSPNAMYYHLKHLEHLEAEHTGKILGADVFFELAMQIYLLHINS